MDYTNYTIDSGYLSQGQAEIIANFHFKCGQRALKPESYKSVSVGFYKGKCFHVAFNN